MTEQKIGLEAPIESLEIERGRVVKALSDVKYQETYPYQKQTIRQILEQYDKAIKILEGVK